MKLSKKYLIALFVIFAQFTMATPKDPNWSKIYADQLFQLTEVMVTDVASPPVAARIYAYATLASYLTIQSNGGKFAHQSLLDDTYFAQTIWPSPERPLTSPEFASILALLEVGESIMPSGYLLQEKQENWIKEALKAKIISKKELQSHLDYSTMIAKSVLEIAKKDGYLQLSTLTRYTPATGEGYWYPTPPAYISAVEPEWKTIKPFYIQNLSEFKPVAMAPFDLSEGSSFHKQLLEVYTVTQNLTDEQKLIANFWDCNPFKVDFSGHMAIGIKKISPGGHWIGIAGIAAEKQQLSFAETAYVHAMVGMTLHDAFISCWEGKYETNRIRPETVINQKMDQRWRPLLQTPPFPEYTSGHSVISRASAVVLTGYFGDNFEFIDDSEVYFGLPERPFKSFLLASEEAAISRLYGGIHFRDAIENGVSQGEKIGEMIWSKAKGKN
jgi:hypothetical protein